MSLEEKYAPTKLSDVVFSDPDTQRLMQQYAAGASDKSLLLYGSYGTGKTTLARVLPYEITGDLQAPDVRVIDSSDQRSYTDIKNSLDSFVEVYGRNDHGRRYIIIDEVDSLKQDAQDYLRGVLLKERSSGFFILTTNTLSGVSGAIRSRCRQVRIDPASANDWLERAHYILKSEGWARITDAQILKTITPVVGDNRKVLEALENLMLKLKSLKVVPT